MKRLIFLSTVLSLALIFGACSELKNNTAPTQSETSIHGVGFADTTNILSPNFHKAYIGSHKWDLQLCKTCHSPSYSGGTANQTCLSCHNKANGPENCGTCHGDMNSATWKDLSGNTSVTHTTHVGSSINCTTCHVVPTKLLDAGHIDENGKAEVKLDTVFYVGNNQSYSPSTSTCSNTYCHGNFPSGNGSSSVSWKDVSGNPGKCGTCHGDVTKTDPEERARPKTISQGGTHPEKLINGTQFHCNGCHVAVVGSITDLDTNGDLKIINKSLHANGRIN